MKPAVVILLDDDTNDLILAKRILEQEKLFNMVHGFSDPEKALRFLQTEHVDVLIIDIGLGTLSGLDVLESAKKQGLLQDKASIVISGVKDSELVAQADLLGVAAWIDKPLNIKKLHYVVMHVPELFMSIVRP